MSKLLVPGRVWSRDRPGGWWLWLWLLRQFEMEQTLAGAGLGGAGERTAGAVRAARQADRRSCICSDGAHVPEEPA